MFLRLFKINSYILSKVILCSALVIDSKNDFSDEFIRIYFLVLLKRCKKTLLLFIFKAANFKVANNKARNDSCIIL